MKTTPKEVCYVFVDNWSWPRAIFKKGKKVFLEITLCNASCNCEACTERIKEIEEISKIEKIKFTKKYLQHRGKTKLFVGLSIPRENTDFVSFFAEKTGFYFEKGPANW